MKERIDDILNQLSEEERLRKESADKSIMGKTRERIKAIDTIATSLMALFQLVWRVIGPAYSVVRFILINLFWKYYKPVWDKFAYVGDPKTFSKTRGAVTLVGSLVGIWMIYYAMFFVADLTLYVVTGRVDEVVYLSNAQEIGPVENIFSVQGCEAVETGQTFSCSEDESLYFRIEPSGFAHIWSVVSRGNFFYPDYVAAPIAPGWQKCVITSYGFRMKTMVRQWEIYPELLSARCEEM
jgi:hypothetical protein